MTAAYAHKFARVTISGTCLGGAEEWSTGFQMGSPTVDISDVQAPGAENIGLAWETFFETAANGFSSSYKTTQVKVAAINTNGTTDTEMIDYYTYATPITGGGTTAVLPPQITLAATLTSDNQRGLAAKGRMYLPGLNIAVQNTNGQLISSYVVTLATNFKTFLDAVNVAAGTSGKLILASKGHKQTTLDENGQPQYLAGKSAWVTGCRIGSVYDTQRRRRNGLVEAYEARVLAA
jgi:hypothetical protein